MGRVNSPATSDGEGPLLRAPGDNSTAKTAQVTLVPYDHRWPAAFRAEETRIGEVIGPSLALQHIGSTAVPGMLAKPIIDMMGEVIAFAEVDAMTPALVALGYEAMGPYGIPGRRYFRRECQGRRSHHLHVFEVGSPGALRHVALRDYLRAKPSEVHAYAAEKRQAAAGADFASYHEAKSPFLAALEARALDWAARPRVVRSLNDEDATRCVDIRVEAGCYAWIECRRDPEDSYGWRPTGLGGQGYATQEAAQAAAADHCPWIAK